MNLIKTISFFSYKGGAGRSTLAFNTIPLLARNHLHPTKENPIIVVDMDIDSCGMSYLLNIEQKDITTENCVQYLLSKSIDNTIYPSVSEHPFLGKLLPVGNAFGYDEDEAILLLPAMDNRDVTSNSRTSNYNDGGGVNFKNQMNTFRTVCERHGVQALIFDSSVGNNATANVSNETADIIICCMRPTTQFVNGTYRYLLGLEAATDDPNHKLLSQKEIVIVPNVVPQKPCVINGRQYPDTTVERVCSRFEVKFGGDDNNHYYHLDFVNRNQFGIPAVDRFMWCEDILCIQPDSDLTDIDRQALDRYRALAAKIDEIEV